MKQSAAKTIGVAALGAAFAAVGAGAANAAPAVPDASKTLDTVTKALPTERVAETLPSGGEAVPQAKTSLEHGVAAAQPVAGKVLADGPGTKLLGGLPTQGLPVHVAPLG